ncbi:DUF805 domain-containing protein [Arsenicicoccus dermatophilus]|uniref:DUF805 domain-containing protein n=1 Tax=Arsenicicoccus dermatophilus TaxID=1076331 RepID=UPI003917210E
MSFGDAVKTCFRKYVVFSGRARRREFWFWALFTVLVSLLTGVVDSLLGFGAAGVDAGSTSNGSSLSLTDSVGPAQTLATLALFLPSIAVTARRLHDTGRSGWWQLLSLIPILGGLVLLFWEVKDSQTGTNSHGPNPKGVGDDAGLGGFPGAAYGQPQGQPYGQTPPAPPAYGQPQPGTSDQPPSGSPYSG